jgi:hypothetical protein
MSDFDDADYFTDASIAVDPYAYWDWARAHGQVW